MPTSALASPKPLTPTQVHARILKRGIGNWVGVEVMSGAAFGGRIVSIDDQSFGLQLYDDPAITPVFYHDVVSLHMGLTQRGFWTITAVGAAGAVVFALVAHHEFESFKNSEPVLPTQPTQPVFPY
jgi:hypothetical protein